MREIAAVLSDEAVTDFQLTLGDTINLHGTHRRSDGCHSVKRRPSIDAWAGSKNRGTAVVGSLLAQA
jgi:hypothetical protein